MTQEARRARVVPLRGERVRVGAAILSEAPAALRSTATFCKKRLDELARIIRHRHGVGALGDNEVSRAYAIFAAHHIREPNRIAQWIDLHIPAMAAGTRDAIVGFAVSEPRKWTADQAGHHLGLQLEERTALGVQTIGACDAGKRRRRAIAEDKKRARDRRNAEARRRRAGAAERGEYLKQASSTAAAAAKAGVSARTLQIRRREIADLIILRRFVAPYSYRMIARDGRAKNFKPEARKPRLVTFRISPRSAPVTVDANELEPLSKQVARAFMDLMRARMRYTDLLAEEQARLERELYAPAKRRGRKPKGAM